MKITTLLKYTTSALLVFSLISTLSVFVQLKRMESDGRVVNFAGIVRGGTQRLIKLELSGHQSDELSARLDALIKGLLDGDEKLQLPPASDGTFLSAMRETAKAWDELKPRIEAARRNKGQQEACSRPARTISSSRTRLWELPKPILKAT